MSPEEKTRALEVLQMMETDIEDDVNKHIGMPVTGERVAQMHGELSAVVASLVIIVRKLIEEDAQ